jgi:hypothetical protein
MLDKQSSSNYLGGFMGRLDFRNIDKEEDLDDLTKILGSIDLEDSISRLRQVNHIIDFCDRHLP